MPSAVDGKPVSELRSPAAQPPASIVQACASPASLTADMAGKGMSAGQVERLWAGDRNALEACRQRHGALVKFIQDRDRALIGGGGRASAR